MNYEYVLKGVFIGINLDLVNTKPHPNTQNHSLVQDIFSFYQRVMEPLCEQGFSQDLETGCPKLAIVKLLGIQNFKGDHNIFRFQP